MIDRKTTLNQMLGTSHKLLEVLKGLETSQNEVFSGHTTQLKVVYEHKDFSLSAAHAFTRFGLRTIVNGRLGFITSNNLTDAGLREFAREGQAMASLAPKSDHNKICSDPSGPKNFECFDPALSESTPREILQWAEDMIFEARKDPRVSIDRGEFTLSLSTWSVCNSQGVERQAAQSSADWFIMGMGKTDQEVTSFDYDGATVGKKSHIEDEIQDSIARFRESVLNSLGAEKGVSYKGPVLLHPYAVLQLLGSVVTANCNGQSHVDGFSPWKDKMGQQVASDQINVFEDPLNVDRPSGWSPFDREGFLSSKHELISEGKMSFVAHNTMSASRAGVASTGNAVGNSLALPRVGFSNIALTGSSRARLLNDDAMMKELGKGLVVKRFSGNSDPISGQFSGVAKNSWWVEGGKYSRPVHEVMISGNMFDLLKQVLCVGQLNHILMGNSMAPYVLVDGVSVTAG